MNPALMDTIMHRRTADRPEDEELAYVPHDPTGLIAFEPQAAHMPMPYGVVAAQSQPFYGQVFDSTDDAHCAARRR